MIRLPTSRSRSLSSRSKAMVVSGVGSACTNRSRSRVPRASKPDSCTTKGWRVVANRTWVGVGWIIEGTPCEGHDGCAHFHHGIKGVPLASNRLLTG